MLFCFVFLQRMNTDEDKTFEQSLSDFPTPFQLKLKTVNKTKLKITRDKLLSKISSGFVFLDEEIQVYNLVSYLSFLIGEAELAFEYNEKVLEKRRNNVIALGNRARFNRLNGKFYQAKNDVERLLTSYKNEPYTNGIDAKNLAKGELAFSYGRCGPNYLEQAISIYETVLQHELPTGDVLVLWKYDCGLCLRRTLHVFNSALFPDRNFPDTCRQACDIFSDIVQTSHEKIYKARAWCELGQLAFNIQKHPETYVCAVSEYISVHEQVDTCLDYFKKALELGGDDFDVIEVCAKFFRYFYKYEEAVQLFRKALKLRDTSFARHHLALSLQSIEKCKEQQSRSPRTVPGSQHETEILYTKLVLKSNRNPAQLQQNEAMDEVLSNLEQAISLDSTNLRAVYDKALVLRRLGHTDEAKNLFHDTATSLELGELKVSCLEQAGFCCLDMAKKETGEMRKEYHYDANILFQKAVEVSAILAVKVNYSTMEFRPLFPTVQRLITDPDALETHNEQIKHLKKLLKTHARYFYMASSDVTQDTDDLFNKCDQVGRKDNAAFNAVLKRFVADKDEDEYEADMVTILEAATASLSKGDNRSASLRYQIWYELLKMRDPETTKHKEYDVFLMTDGDSENLKPMSIVSSWLKDYCGFSIANSDDNCAVGQPLISSLTEFCEASTSVVLIIKTAEIDRGLRFVIDTIASSEPSGIKTILVILKEDSVKLPTTWKNITKLDLPTDIETENKEYIAVWIENFLKSLMERHVNV